MLGASIPVGVGVLHAVMGNGGAEGVLVIRRGQDSRPDCGGANGHAGIVRQRGRRDRGHIGVDGRHHEGSHRDSVGVHLGFIGADALDRALGQGQVFVIDRAHGLGAHHHLVPCHTLEGNGGELAGVVRHGVGRGGQLHGHAGCGLPGLPLHAGEQVQRGVVCLAGDAERRGLRLLTGQGDEVGAFLRLSLMVIGVLAVAGPGVAGLPHRHVIRVPGGGGERVELVGYKARRGDHLVVRVAGNARNGLGGEDALGGVKQGLVAVFHPDHDVVVYVREAGPGGEGRIVVEHRHLPGALILVEGLIGVVGIAGLIGIGQQLPLNADGVGGEGIAVAAVQALRKSNEVAPVDL